MKNLKQTFGVALVASLLALALGAGTAHAQFCTPPSSGEVSRWQGDGNASDSVDGNHGTLMNGAAFGSGLLGQAFVLDGNDDYVSVPDASSLDFTTALALSAWIKPDIPANGDLQTVMSKPNVAGGTGYRLGLMADGKPNLGMNNGGGTNCVLTGPTAPAAGQWAHLVATFGSRLTKLYVNGQEVSSGFCSALFTLQNSAQPFQIGREFAILGGRPFDGSIDQVRIFNRALTAAEARALFDPDCDGVGDNTDNCPLDVNPDQADNEGDHIGDICDPDDDNDAVVDTSDNCPLVANADQADNDLDTLGDACDPDNDNDGVADSTDNCPFNANADQADFDQDGIGDVCDADADGDGVLAGDNCPWTPNADQADNDSDGSGDACDLDDDNDGVLDDVDNCPLDVNAEQADLDADNIGDACDADLDGDGILNGDDNCPLAANPAQDNADGDSEGDACDLDDDNDGVLDTADNCSLIVNPGQEDLDNDGTGDACDGDLDGDGVANDFDNCPVTPNGDQLDFDADGEGDACDADIDGDGVLNGADVCAFTPGGVVVDAATGCSIAQLCPCAGPRGTTQTWKNHGQYVSCVAKSAQSFAKAGLITAAEKDALTSAAGQSSCGK